MLLESLVGEIPFSNNDGTLVWHAVAGSNSFNI